MFRVKKVLKEKIITLIKIEGEISEEDNEEWKLILDEELQKEDSIIIDFSDASFIHEKNIQSLVLKMGSNIMLINCSCTLRNIFQSKGLSKNLLE